MAKRFTDTDKWKKGWFKQLNPKQRLFWLYVLDDCSAAGIWDVDLEVAGIRIGEPINSDEAVEVLGKDVVWFDSNEKIFIPTYFGKSRFRIYKYLSKRLKKLVNPKTLTLEKSLDK